METTIINSLNALMVKYFLSSEIVKSCNHKALSYLSS